MHHSSENDLLDQDHLKALRKEMLSEIPGQTLGATGRHPEGKLTKSDEGEIQFAVAADPRSKKVLLNFGKPVAWMGMDAK